MKPDGSFAAWKDASSSAPSRSTTRGTPGSTGTSEPAARQSATKAATSSASPAYCVRHILPGALLLGDACAAFGDGRGGGRLGERGEKPEGGRARERRGGFEVEHGAGIGPVARLRVIAGDAVHPGDAQCAQRQQFALQGGAVAVAGVEPHPHPQPGRADQRRTVGRRKLHAGASGVAGEDGVDAADERLGRRPTASARRARTGKPVNTSGRRAAISTSSRPAGVAASTGLRRRPPMSPRWSGSSSAPGGRGSGTRTGSGAPRTSRRR
jgi:hypothetical protein